MKTQTSPETAATSPQRKREITRQKEKVLDLVPEAIIMLDQDDRVRFWNQNAERLYGRHAAEAEGQKWADLVFHDPRDYAAAKARLLQTGTLQGEFLHHAKDGQEIVVASRWSLARGEQGRPSCILVVNTDITDKRKIETEFLHVQRISSIGALSTGLAHDLNNVLAPILMVAEILREKASDQESQQLLATIETSARRGAGIIKQLLGFARGIAGQQMLAQPRHLLRGVIKVLKETFPRSIEIASRIDPDLWTIICNATQFEQVLFNLCLNGRDSMPKGGILSVSAENTWFASQADAGASRTPCVLLQVADTGTGIAPEILDKIFDPFFTTKEFGQGTGLGLSTALRIVKSHHGVLCVQSALGKGSIFRVYWPATPSAPEKWLETASPPLPAGQGELVLIVDDETPILEVTQRILESHRYRVLVAKDGVEALNLFRRHRREIKVVLADIVMPVMDGVALAQTLKRLDPELIIIATSGLGSGLGQPDKTAALRSLNVAKFVAKPFAADQLLAALHESLHPQGNN